MRSESVTVLTIAELLAQYGGSIKTGPFGTTLKASEYTEAGVPLISVREIGHGSFHVDSKTPRIGKETLARLPEYVLEEGDIVFARKGGIERCALIRQHQAGWFLGSDGIRLRPPKACDARFLAYSLQTPSVKEWLVRHSTGSTMASLNQGTIGRLPVALPPLGVQCAVADALQAFDDRIDLLRQTNATLESIAQALFKSWFIDFDPVHAKAEGREPGGMDAATAALFPAEFEESALGLIPKGWSAGSLADLSMLNAASWTRRRAPAEVTYVDLAGVKSNVFDPPQRYCFADAPSRARRSLRAGDTLVGTVRPGNRSFGFIAEAEPGLTGSTGFAVLSPTTSFGAAFVYLSATRDENIDRLAALADGGAYPAVRPELVHSTPCVVPPEVVLRAFHSVASPLLVSIAANTQRGRTLGELRDTLLPRLISGKLRLPEAEAAIEAVA